MSYKNLDDKAREGLSNVNFEPLSRYEMKNCIAKPIKPVKGFFTWIACNFHLIIFGMIALIGFVGAVGVYFDWLKL